MAENESTPNRAGMVALVGRPNVGKSTLMNVLIGDKVSIITPVAQTTRNQIRGIQNLDHAQIVYLDTPGIHHARKALNRYMVDVALRALSEVDLVLYLIDASRPDPAIVPVKPSKPSKRSGDPLRNPGYREDVFILEQLRKSSVPAFLVVNKIDLITEKTLLLPLIDHYASENVFEEVLPIAATTGEGLDALVEEIVKRLPEGPPLFPVDFSTDMAERFLVAEMIREKLILHTRQELPHSTAVIIENFDESERDDVSPTGRADSSLASLAEELVSPPETDEERAVMAAVDADADALDDASATDEEWHAMDEEALDEEALAARDEEFDSFDEAPAASTTRHGLVRIDATIVVERPSQKGIVIGKRGAMLKTVGTEARQDIERLLGCRVYLQLWVRVAKNWSKNEKTLRQLGYRD